MLALQICTGKLDIVSKPRNLTEQITKLRERDGGFLSEAKAESAREAVKYPAKGITATVPARRMANDYFMWVSYTLFAAALVTQVCLMTWLDLL
jgi:hypothetical protein